MKTLLVAAALVAAFALPAAPTFAGEKMTSADLKCMLFPFVSDCAPVVEKAHAEMVASMSEHHMTMPTNWLGCEKAPAGSGHLLNCAKP